MQNFLTNRTVSDRKEDVLRNVPWEDEEQKRFVFRIKALEDFVKRENIMPRFTRHELSQRIRDQLGGGPTSEDVKNQRNVRLWEVPMDAVARAPELDPPTEEREVI
jgi:hypothetical protein